MTVTINASTSTGLVQTADLSGALALQANGTTKFTVGSTGAYGQLVSGTAVASTSGTSVDFTGIPSWAKRITLMYSGVSTTGSLMLIQLGSGSITTTGYLSGSQLQSGTAVNFASSTSGFYVYFNTATSTLHGSMTFCNITGNTWVGNGYFYMSSTFATTSAGSITLSGSLDRIRTTSVNGTDTFDAGTINILYEG